MLQSLRAAIADLGSRRGDGEAQQIVASANALLDELMLRTDRAFYLQYVRSGWSLLREVTPAILEQLTPEARALIEPTLGESRELDAGAAVDLDALNCASERLRQCFERIGALLVASPAQQAIHSLQKLIDWEAQIYTRSAQFKAPPPAQEQAPLTREQLERYLRAKFPDRPELRIVDFKPLTGGLQKTTVLFEIEHGKGERESLVLRGEQPPAFLVFDLSEIPDEFAVVKIAFAAGLPVAEPLWLETDASLLGRRFLVSRKVSGTNYGTAIATDKAMPGEVARAFVVTLAQLHRTPLEQHADQIARTRIGYWLEYENLAQNTLANVQRWSKLLRTRAHAASPALAALYSWLVENVPEENASPCLLHCDYAPHNVLIDVDRVSGILDWEVARIGDAAEDLAYFLESTTGQVRREDALRWYGEAGGPYISSARLRYFEIFHSLKLIVSCLAAASLFENEEDARSVWGMIAIKWTHPCMAPASQRLAGAIGAGSTHSPAAGGPDD